MNLTLWIAAGLLAVVALVGGISKVFVPKEKLADPHSFFVTGLTAALVTDDARWNMRGRNLAIHSGGETEKIRFDTAADVLDVLTGRFGIDVADLGDRADVEARVNEVLDS